MLPRPRARRRRPLQYITNIFGCVKKNKSPIKQAAPILIPDSPDLFIVETPNNSVHEDMESQTEEVIITEVEIHQVPNPAGDNASQEIYTARPLVPYSQSSESSQESELHFHLTPTPITYSQDSEDDKIEPSQMPPRRLKSASTQVLCESQSSEIDSYAELSGKNSESSQKSVESNQDSSSPIGSSNDSRFPPQRSPFDSSDSRLNRTHSGSNSTTDYFTRTDNSSNDTTDFFNSQAKSTDLENSDCVIISSSETVNTVNSDDPFGSPLYYSTPKQSVSSDSSILIPPNAPKRKKKQEKDH
ncbi:dentin sialophosphoprotein-like [Mercenaria mercenaria]|uniref:dentin sialophosphoprotein-like n=1 Tax=Mercenaria mercenaria TaxID=6596 RepID=UPI00234F0C67|nr:dentin sialophosphoprotein-like [Mercenaria mercenaria]